MVFMGASFWPVLVGLDPVLGKLLRMAVFLAICLGTVILFHVGGKREKRVLKPQNLLILASFGVPIYFAVKLYDSMTTYASFVTASTLMVPLLVAMGVARWEERNFVPSSDIPAEKDAEGRSGEEAEQCPQRHEWSERDVPAVDDLSQGQQNTEGAAEKEREPCSGEKFCPSDEAAGHPQHAAQPDVAVPETARVHEPEREVESAQD